MKKRSDILLIPALLLNSTFSVNAWAQPTTSQAKAEMYKCLSAPMGAANYTWSFQVAQDIMQKIDYRTNFDQLKQSLELTNPVRDAVKTAAQKSLGMAVQNFSPATLLKPGFNASTEVMNLVNKFTDQLRQVLANVRVTQETNFQVMLAPKISEELAARRGGSDSREIPIMTQFPSDRLVVFQNMAESDSAFKSAEDRMVTDIYAGISNYFQKATECKLTQPYLAAVTINVKVMPSAADSVVSAQIILGMPTGIEMEFKQANDQVQFEKIAFPTVNVKNLAVNNGGIPDASQFPVAIINMNQKLVGSTDIPVHIEFGPLGTYQNKKWVRTPGTDYSALVPKLKGTAVGNAIKKAIAVDFNIYNLSLNLAKQEVTDLDIFLSIGYRRFPNVKLGRINKPDVDAQFQSEINKTIQQQITAQKEKLKRIGAGSLTEQEQQAVAAAAAKIGEQQGFSPDFTKQLIQSLFGAMGSLK